MNKEERSGSLTVVGLGPGRAGLITRETWSLLQGAEHVVLRTKIHPTVAALDDAGISYETYDNRYEHAADFETLYASIVRDLLSRAKQGESIVYAVPGSPLVAERTVVLLREHAAEYPSVRLRILPGMSFVEVLYTRLGFDPVDGMMLLDAMDAMQLERASRQNLIITQVWNPGIASDLKLALMDLYGDEYPVTYVHNLALSDESIRELPLYELDRQQDIDHLTTLFLRRQLEGEKLA